MKAALMLTILMSFQVSADPRVIYGEDDRVEVSDSDNALWRELAISTAAMIRKSRVSISGDTATITGSKFSNRVCTSERFANQLTAASCSGFLVGSKYLVTAGHCISDSSDCSNYKWVFDYKKESLVGNKAQVDSSKVYSCKRIMEYAYSNRDDYTLLELDREVTDREPLKFRTEGKIKKGTKLVVIGHPSGLPTKIAGGAQVRSLQGKYFVANLDTYGGNSGSAVFDAESGVVEGILVRGERDYRWNSNGRCYVSNVVADNAGRGEDVTYITNIRALQNLGK